jgi:hypothetical protein
MTVRLIALALALFATIWLLESVITGARVLLFPT